ncbi:META domain-containing protein [Sinorhizobium meliloti]|nr:META domain-containing protein [Sinorhizobium meliloti]
MAAWPAAIISPGRSASPAATITFGPAAATRKMCVPAVMDQERKFFEALKNGACWRIEGSKLFLGGRNEKRCCS